MIIASGWAKGLKLAVPRGDSTRPTGARVRAAILDTLMPYLDEGRFLDVFAGSGAMGIEALSRGAPGAVFVEKEREALACLRTNLAELTRRAAAQSLPDVPVAVIGRDAAAALPLLDQHGPFAVLFADPPYRDAVAWLERVAGPLAEVAAPAAVLVFECAARDGAAVAAAGAPWTLLKQKLYGDTMVTIYRR